MMDSLASLCMVYNNKLNVYKCIKMLDEVADSMASLQVHSSHLVCGIV